jgi:cytochrome c oxidase cbb3-type subunit 4
VTKIQAYFQTDWLAMTATDWVGLTINVVIFIALLVLFYWVFNPKNKEKLEAHRHLPFRDERDSSGNKHG